MSSQKPKSKPQIAQFFSRTFFSPKGQDTAPKSDASRKRDSMPPETPAGVGKGSPERSNSVPPSADATATASSQGDARTGKFVKVISENVANLETLRNLSWNGIPSGHRATVWKLLLGYLTANKAQREEALARKRKEYILSIPQFMEPEKSESEKLTMHQIGIDLPRTAPNIPLFGHPRIRALMERLLYIWAMLHPASGYVQGLNDILTPIICVFLSEYTPLFNEHGEFVTDNPNIDALDESQLESLEADSYWCFTKLLDSIQDNYTSNQPGIVRALDKLQELVRIIDQPLDRHIAEERMMYVEFTFRWINCLMLRDLSLPLVIRLWDTYLAEPNGEGFSVLHIYTCAALLLKYAPDIKKRRMPELMLFLQHLPTESWSFADLEGVISQAYVYRTLFQNSHRLKQ